MSKFIALSLLFSGMTACTWVGVTDEGKTVSLRQASEIANCERVGNARSKTLNKIIGIGRGADKLQTELVDLARNEAGSMGGNVIVAESLIEEGEQSYGVYRCP